MIISRCCKKSVYVYTINDGDAHYVCNACDFPCDTITSLSLIRNGQDDIRNDGEIEAVISQT
jgi:hypothetical protein